MVNKLEFREKMFEEVCNNNTMKERELDILFDTYNLKTLGTAYKNLRYAVDCGKVPMDVKYYGYHCRWVEERNDTERSSGYQKDRKRASKFTNVEDLIEKYPQFEERLNSLARGGYSRGYIMSHIGYWEKDDQVAQSVKEAEKIMPYLSVEGQMKLADDFFFAIFNDFFLLKAFNAIHRGFCANRPGNPQNLKDAFDTSIVNFLARNKNLYASYIDSEKSQQIDTFHIFEKELLRKLKI